ncbi:Hypothetical_protein [Hexamita inflata]|uniref:Hypothetical_protein n=1 Tax=Hexamita inflata TaxID=28002 RepID=A0ABP1HR06_9EUKA
MQRPVRKVFTHLQQLTINYSIIIISDATSLIIYSFIQSNKCSNGQIINATAKSNLSFEEKQNILSKYTDVKLEQKEINGALIRREYEIVNERIIQFVNNKQNEIAMELAFKDILLQHKDEETSKYIQELKIQIQDLQRINNEQKREYELKLSECLQKYDAELIKCKNEVEAQQKEFQRDLQNEYDKYKAEIEQLKMMNDVEKQNMEKIRDFQKNIHVPDQEIDMNDMIANQLRIECQLLKQQLIDENLAHEEEQTILQQLLKQKTQRNAEIQKQLTEEKTLRLLFFSQLQQKQSEITKLLECNIKDQAARIIHLENENQSLQSTLNTLKEQIEKLNVQEYQKRIDIQNKQLEDKDQYITKLKEEMEAININQLQDKQIEKILTLLKSMDVSK